ncbi:hypothetical protein [Arthrobacter sp. NPDC089319]|uniref:hypothetical protein n=1 Tax=Arthrobacter sp. NPDC089319 TaxID=3155915 RepID=UPI003429DFFB
MGELRGAGGRRRMSRAHNRLTEGGTRGSGRGTWRNAVLTLMGSAALIGSMAGCGIIPGFEAPPCLPPDYSVTPKEAGPGETVTVSARDADCDPRYGSEAQIEVIVTDASAVEVLHETAPMNDGGGFTYTFTVPADAAAGEGSVTAMPYNVDWCDDTGRNNRVSGAAAVVELERVSCAMPLRPLLITR